MSASPGETGYSATKGAIAAAVRAMAIELARRRIRVNTVSPGLVMTPMTDRALGSSLAGQVAAIEQKHPLGFGYACGCRSGGRVSVGAGDYVDHRNRTDCRWRILSAIISLMSSDVTSSAAMTLERGACVGSGNLRGTRPNIQQNTRRADIAAWDSLGQLILMSALDQQFGIRLNQAELASLSSVQDILNILSKNQRLQTS